MLTSIAVIGCRGLYVTQIHDLRNRLDEINRYPGSTIKLDNLAAQMSDDDAVERKRTYKIIRTKPDGLSYARDIAMKYGLVLEEMLRRNKSYRRSGS